MIVIEGVECPECHVSYPAGTHSFWCSKFILNSAEGINYVDAVRGKVDLVNHPPHYTSHPSGVECIQITRHMSFNLGNAIKYLWRFDRKNGIEDLQKAIWYINDEIERLKDAKT